MPGKIPQSNELNQWEIIFQVVSEKKKKLKICPKQINQLRFLMERVAHGSGAEFLETTGAPFPLGTGEEPILWWTH